MTDGAKVKMIESSNSKDVVSDLALNTDEQRMIMEVGILQEKAEDE